jgi:glycosyltransferase involved in cell wall biosynthesis
MTTVLIDGIIFGLQRRGGISRYFAEIISRLAGQCPDLGLLLHLPIGCEGAPEHARIRPVRDLAAMPWRFRERFSQMRLRRRRPAIFHSTYYRLPYWGGMKTVATVYDFMHEQFPAMLGDSALVERKRACLESADIIVSISRRTRDQLLRFLRVDEKKIRVAHLAASDCFANAPSEDEVNAFLDRAGLRRPYWLFVGQRGAYKNFAAMLDAFVAVARRADAHLVLAGGGATLDPRHAETLIRRRCEGRVRVLGNPGDDELRLAYGGAAAFVFPSLEEGFGLPLLEAMGAGAPVIASDIEVFHEVAGEAAAYFDPHDAEALARALADSLEEGYRRKWQPRGFKRRGQFSWDKTAEAYKDAYGALA